MGPPSPSVTVIVPGKCEIMLLFLKYSGYTVKDKCHLNLLLCLNSCYLGCMFSHRRTCRAIPVPQAVPGPAVAKAVSVPAVPQSVPGPADPQAVPGLAVPQAVPGLAVPQAVPGPSVPQQELFVVTVPIADEIEIMAKEEDSTFWME
jgi:hypothetical protein